MMLAGEGAVSRHRDRSPVSGPDPVPHDDRAAQTCGRLRCPGYRRRRLPRKNRTLAGRSARRRVKYGYHSVPKGT